MTPYQLAQRAGVSLDSVRDHQAGRWVTPFARTRIEEAEQRDRTARAQQERSYDLSQEAMFGGVALEGMTAGMDDVLEQQKIIQAKLPSDVALHEAKKIPGVKVVEKPDGSFTATGTDAESSKRLAHLDDGARQLKVARGTKVAARKRHNRVRVKTREGKEVEIEGRSEAEYAKRKLIKPAGPKRRR